MIRILVTPLLAIGLSHAAAIYAVTDLGAPTVPANIAVKTPALANGLWSAVYGMNSAGDYVGYGDAGAGHFRAFVWDSLSGLSMLGTLGGEDSWGMAINEEDVVAGHSTTAFGFLHAFIEENGQLFDLGTLGGNSSYAYGINDSGAVVGYSVTANGDLHAFVASGGSMLDLNALLPDRSGWLLTAAYGIDDKGSITGTGVFQGSAHEFRLDPISGALANLNGAAVPEPATLLLTGAALALIGWVRLRRS